MNRLFEIDGRRVNSLDCMLNREPVEIRVNYRFLDNGEK